MIYEMRTYHAVPGMLPALNQRFADHIVPIFQKHGVGTVGFWTNDIGQSNQLIYILSYENMADREKRFGSVIADPEV